MTQPPQELTYDRELSRTQSVARQLARRPASGGVSALDPSIQVFNASQIRLGRIGAAILRNGAAAAQNIATTGTLGQTSTALLHNSVWYQSNMTADIGSTPTRLVCVVAGYYEITVSVAWGTFFTPLGKGACIGFNINSTSGVVTAQLNGIAPVGDTFIQTVTFPYFLNANDYITQTLGHNMGVNEPAPIGYLAAHRVSL